MILEPLLFKNFHVVCFVPGYLWLAMKFHFICLRKNKNKTFTLPNFCIRDPNTTFFGALKPPFTCQQEKKFNQFNNNSNKAQQQKVPP